MVTRQKKSFDCIQSKRKAQAKIYQTVKKLSPEEEAMLQKSAAAVAKTRDDLKM